MQIRNEDNQFRTRALDFAGYLFAKRYQLSAVKRDEGGAFCWFIFADKEKCEQEEQKFLRSEAVVNAKNYAEAIKYLKRKVSR
jgi:hypothetical protein